MIAHTAQIQIFEHLNNLGNKEKMLDSLHETSLIYHGPTVVIESARMLIIQISLQNKIKLNLIVTL